jgi:hypothetical protein
VLNHQHRIAAVAEPAQQGEQAVGVAGMEPDAGLVQHVERVHQPGPERVGERDALGLSAGQGAGLAVEGQIAQAHVEQEVHPGQQLVENGRRDLPGGAGPGDLPEPAGQRVQRQGGYVGDGPAGHPDRQRMLVEPGAAAGRTGLGELVLAQEDPDVLLVALLLQRLEEGKDPEIFAGPAVEQLPAHRRLERLPGLRRIGSQLARGVQQQLPAGLVARLGPGVDGAFDQAPV